MNFSYEQRESIYNAMVNASEELYSELYFEYESFGLEHVEFWCKDVSATHWSGTRRKVLYIQYGTIQIDSILEDRKLTYATQIPWIIEWHKIYGNSPLADLVFLIAHEIAHAVNYFGYKKGVISRHKSHGNMWAQIYHKIVRTHFHDVAQRLIDLSGVEELKYQRFSSAMERRETLHILSREMLRVGDRIQFTRKTGEVVTGRIRHMARKWLHIIRDDTNEQWKVLPSFVTKIG